MANALYDKGREAILNGAINLSAPFTISAILLTNAYTPDLANHSTLTDVNLHFAASSQNLTGQSVTNGVFGADPVTFPAVGAGSTVPYVLVYLDVGLSDFSLLIGLFDTTDSGPLSLVTNGSDITINWPTTGDKIFRI